MKNKDERAQEATQFLDNLESFLAENSPKPDELVEDLRAKGLDPVELVHDLNQLLAEHAPTWKQRAERERLAALESLPKSSMKRTRHETEVGIGSLISQIQQFGVQISPGAYHQKFQVATDADLESLLEDLETQLEILKKKHNE